jgi:hypothetical protein
MSQVDASLTKSDQPAATPPTEPQISRRRILAVYKQMLVSLFVATLVIIGILLALILPFFISYYFKGQEDAHSPPLLPVVALAGALGAFFSVLMRLYNFEDLPKAIVSSDLDGLPTTHLVIYSLVPAVVGSIAAAVIYMLFASELLRGELFPTFACKKGENLCNSFAMLIGEWSPKEAPDYAKTIVWGFIGGFAERLVPDTLQSLSQSTNKDNSK